MRRLAFIRAAQNVGASRRTPPTKLLPTVLVSDACRLRSPK
jgi:hypothetical protein